MPVIDPLMAQDPVAQARTARAEAIAAAEREAPASNAVEAAIATSALPRFIDTTLAEALVLGLLRQGVSRYICVLGHGSTEIGEVLRIYQAAGLLRAFNVRSEVEASHAACALRWVTGEKAAVVTSIGPGALQAMAASIVSASDGIGVWYLFGDETTEDEGPNMQQIPKHEQGLYLRLCETMGRAYSLNTPLALSTALRRGMVTVDDPHRGGPFYLLLPMNTQAATLSCFNLDELPCGGIPRLGEAAGDALYEQAADLLLSAERVVVKIGGGAAQAGEELLEFLELTDAAVVHTPMATGIVPYSNPRNQTVGGSKGSLCGNYAMEHADLLVAVGTRFVCQSDSSRTGYPNVRHVININTDAETAVHYGKTLALVGDAGPTLRRLNRVLRGCGMNFRRTPEAQGRLALAGCSGAGAQSVRGRPLPAANGEIPVEEPACPKTQRRETPPWLSECSGKKAAWEEFKAERYACPTLHDEQWGCEVLTQPAAIKAATDWARRNDVITFFDAGDVQANGFQVVEDDRPGRTFTETGASYMGFAVSALLSTALTDVPFYGLALTGDGSFTMSPQILIDGVEHGARGCIVLFDNRTMAAISGLQTAQYGATFATSDSVAVDYVAWARAVAGVLALDGGHSAESLVAALEQARRYAGLALIHVPVYSGPNPLGGMGAFGRWNVGNWCEDVQALRHRIGL